MSLKRMSASILCVAMLVAALPTTLGITVGADIATAPTTDATKEIMDNYVLHTIYEGRTLCRPYPLVACKDGRRTAGGCICFWSDGCFLTGKAVFTCSLVETSMGGSEKSTGGLCAQEYRCE